jgi:hypothetical protein
VFFDDEDRQTYLNLILKYTRKYQATPAIGKTSSKQWNGSKKADIRGEERASA